MSESVFHLSLSFFVSVASHSTASFSSFSFHPLTVLLFVLLKHILEFFHMECILINVANLCISQIFFPFSLIVQLEMKFWLKTVSPKHFESLSLFSSG